MVQGVKEYVFKNLNNKQRYITYGQLFNVASKERGQLI